MGDDALRAALTELIGPIGLTVLEQVSPCSAAEKPQAVLEALRGFGVETPLIQELSRRFGLG